MSVRGVRPDSVLSGVVAALGVLAIVFGVWALYRLAVDGPEDGDPKLLLWGLPGVVVAAGLVAVLVCRKVGLGLASFGVAVAAFVVWLVVVVLSSG